MTNAWGRDGQCRTKPTGDSSGHAGASDREICLHRCLARLCRALVITCHAGEMFAELPYPLRKLTSFGWHGVQLFFLLSCVTLLLSWRADEAKDRASVTGFWTRRLFRIAPMYYLAALFYFVVETPPSGFDLGQFLASFTSMNAWHPGRSSRRCRTAGWWCRVVEHWRRGHVLSHVSNDGRADQRDAWRDRVLCRRVGDRMPLRTRSWTMCFATITAPWQSGISCTSGFPTSCLVFALGAVLYFVLQSLQAKPEHAIAILLRRHSTMIVLTCVAAGVGVANLPLPASLPFASPLGVPAYLVASLIFMIVVAVLAGDPRSPFINRPICSLGQVSFSALPVGTSRCFANCPSCCRTCSTSMPLTGKPSPHGSRYGWW